jgi:hypothetical protein
VRVACESSQYSDRNGIATPSILRNLNRIAAAPSYQATAVNAL